LAAALLALPAFSAEPGILGRWKTIDDKTHKPAAIVLIYEQNGRFFGKIEVNLKRERTVCDLCKGDLKNKPIVGLVFLRDLKPEGNGEYGGGNIVDPDSGSVYRCKAKLTDGGQKLIVRGYIGISLFGRSQTWLREPPAATTPPSPAPPSPGGTPHR
jgi:uncharacterized protein (DUF2147 family)